MQKEDGTLATTPEENAEVFVKHFDKLYKRHLELDDPVLDLLDQHQLPLTVIILQLMKKFRKKSVL